MAKLVKQIEIRTGKLVHELFAGQYESVFKGHGMEFTEVREYAPGDEIRSIDRNVTARLGKPFIKKFVEERELTVMLVVDVSLSGRFGTRTQWKAGIAAELSSLLALSAVKNNDKVGMLTFADRVINYLPPKKGLPHALRLVREALAEPAVGRGTRMDIALQYLNSVLKRRAVAFLISDFFVTGHQQALHITNKHHDLIAIRLVDPRELELPTVGLLTLEDRETGERVLVDTTDARARAQFSQRAREIDQQFHDLMRSAGMDCVDIHTGVSYIKPLVRFFKKRAKRFR